MFEQFFEKALCISGCVFLIATSFKLIDGIALEHAERVQSIHNMEFKSARDEQIQMMLKKLDEQRDSYLLLAQECQRIQENDSN